MNQEACPSAEVLRSYDLGLLGETELDGVAGHLESCPPCAAAAAQWDSQADPMLRDLQRRLGGTARRLNRTEERTAADEAVRTLEHTEERTPSRRPAPVLGAPDRLDDFRIVREIGRGGMGVVYEAYQESLNRHVALKLLREPSDLARFRREAKAAGRLHHTNIVPVHGVGEDSGRHYYVMQYIAGRGLDDVLRERRRGAEKGPGDTAVDYREAARIALQTAEAVAFAHEQGIVHRDIKPSNILLDERGTAWVADFGLAFDIADTETLTHTGDVLGTLRYMAPERFAGRGDAGADIYGLGITLYELATGRPSRRAIGPC
jgi:eukaryotic-like serine/threonine-protein kinase